MLIKNLITTDCVKVTVDCTTLMTEQNPTPIVPLESLFDGSRSGSTLFITSVMIAARLSEYSGLAHERCGRRRTEQKRARKRTGALSALAHTSCASQTLSLALSRRAAQRAHTHPHFLCAMRAFLPPSHPGWLVSQFQLRVSLVSEPHFADISAIYPPSLGNKATR